MAIIQKGAKKDGIEFHQKQMVFLWYLSGLMMKLALLTN